MQWQAIFCALVLFFVIGAGVRGRPFNAWDTWRDIMQAAAIATLVFAWLTAGRGCNDQSTVPDDIEDCRPAGPGIAGC